MSNPAPPIPKTWLLLVALAAMLPYLGTLGAGFTLDDHVIVESNPALRSLASAPDLFRMNYWGEHRQAGLYRPLTLLSYLGNRLLLGPEAWGFHLVNLLLHGGVVLLVIRTGRLFGLEPVPALAGGLLFGLHPLASEAVCGIVGRAELLAAAAVLGTLLLTRAALDRTGLPRILLLMGAGISALAGPLCKEGAVVAGLLPVLLLGNRHPWKLARRLQALVPLSGTLAGLAVRRWGLGVWLRPSDVTVPFQDNPLAHLAGPERLLGALRILAEAFRTILWPVRLSAEYGYDQIPVGSRVSPTGCALGGIALLGFAFLAWTLRRRYPAASRGLVLAGLSYLPVSQLLFPTGTIFGERLLYLPLIGLCLAAAAMGAVAWDRLHPRPLVLAALVLLLTLAGGRTILRTQDWRDDLHLFRAAVRACPRSTKAHYNYGVFLAETRRAEAAETHYRLALTIDPDYGDARYNLAASLHQRGQHAEAADALIPLIKKDRTDAPARVLMGVIFTALEETELAGQVLREATEIDPELVDAWVNLSLLSAALGQEREALGQARRALALQPDDPERHLHLARLYQMLGYPHEARSTRAEAERLGAAPIPAQ